MLLSVREARQRLLQAFTPLGTERVPLSRAAGRVLAEAVRAVRDIPPFSNSSMDGFAVRAADIRGASARAPVVLRVVADIPAGEIGEVHLREGEAARIMTGAPLPPGADTVVPVEDTDFHSREAGVAPPARVEIYRSLRSGDYVREKGEDLRAGQVVLTRGIRLRPQDVGMLAMLGFAEVEVTRPPLVAILPTGDELQPVGVPLQPGKIYESNSYTLTALITRAGGEALHLGVAADNAQDVRSRLDRAVDEGVDLILSTAGVSVGAYDFVRNVVQDHGELDFWRVNMRPGKPLVFGHYRQVPFIGLPGNPVSSFVGFEVFVRFALYKMMGIENWHPQILRGKLAEPVSSDGRESYLRAVVTSKEGELVARLTGHQGSGNQFSLVQANALVIVPAGVDSLPEGSEVAIWLLER